jgi:hypothetical protein
MELFGIIGAAVLQNTTSISQLCIVVGVSFQATSFTSQWLPSYTHPEMLIHAS